MTTKKLLRNGRRWKVCRVVDGIGKLEDGLLLFVCLRSADYSGSNLIKQFCARIH